MEDDVGITILPWHRVGPQLLHEENLICKLRSCACKGKFKLPAFTLADFELFAFHFKIQLTISSGTGFLDPVGQVADKIKEEISLRNTDDLVSDLDKQTKALAGSQVQSLPNILTEILGSCGRINLKSLKLKLA